MRLQYLSISSSEDDDGHGSWEAMASVRPADAAAARAELDELLAWAEAHAPGPRGALDEHGVWDAHLQELQEGPEWTTLTLTLVGPMAWGEALFQQVDTEDP
ncbi:hypothetical protein [Inhella sp.]|uniref:hypothetical protein n=1 Tax=Inhella sp. TaxID=1921806 RepID=UPI0035B3A1F8